MGTRFGRWHRCWSMARPLAGLAVVFLLMSVGLIAASCGGESSSSDTTTPTASELPDTTTEQAASMSGSELGNAVGETWAEAMQELVALLGDMPEPASVRAQVEELKEEYVQKLVALGRQAATLNPGEKATMTAGVASALADAGNEDWYASYSDIYGYYAAEDIELGNLVADFNILTQYADFDLLRQQAPEEATRLGIE